MMIIKKTDKIFHVINSYYIDKMNFVDFRKTKLIDILIMQLINGFNIFDFFFVAVIVVWAIIRNVHNQRNFE